MGIQISENKLSSRAKAALSNAKNKSQFLRDAIEFYVGRDADIVNSDLSILSNDIKEIKMLLVELTQSSLESSSFSEAAAVRNDTVVQVTAIAEQEAPNNNVGSIRDKSTNTLNKSASLSDKEKEALKLLDESIDLFSI